jgi:hypothetical protein
MLITSVRAIYASFSIFDIVVWNISSEINSLISGPTTVPFLSFASERAVKLLQIYLKQFPLFPKAFTNCLTMLSFILKEVNYNFFLINWTFSLRKSEFCRLCRTLTIRFPFYSEPSIYESGNVSPAGPQDTSLTALQPTRHWLTWNWWPVKHKPFRPYHVSRTFLYL